MVDQLSPLAPVLRPGRYGNAAAESRVILAEDAPGSIVQVAAWAGNEAAAVKAIAQVTGLKLDLRPGAGALGKARAAFAIAPGRFLVVNEDEGLDAELIKAIPSATGMVTDLSHGRTAIRIGGPKARWVLSKLFPIDLSPKALGVGDGVSTKHHEIFAQIQRTGVDQFTLYVFRSFARSFWHVLTRSAEEVGYEVR